MRIILLVLISISLAQAAEIDGSVDWSAEKYDKNWANPHRANGEHQCQSVTSLGHKCETLGVNFTDCHHAFMKLKQDDCCSSTRHGGVSIGFKLTYCGRM